MNKSQDSQRVQKRDTTTKKKSVKEKDDNKNNVVQQLYGYKKKKKKNMYCVQILITWYDRLLDQKREMNKKRLHKFIQEQLSYKWELYDIEKDGDRQAATFDFVTGLPVGSVFRLLLFVTGLGCVIGTTSTIFQYTEHSVHYYYDQIILYVEIAMGNIDSHHDDHYDDKNKKGDDGHGDDHHRMLVRQLAGSVSGIGSGYKYVHWVMGATLSAGVICYFTKVYIPECAGAGADAAKICMAVKAPVPFFVGVMRIIFSSIYLGTGNPLGIEAPTLHVCSAMASTMLTLAAKLSPEDFRLEHLPTWVLVGMTAGLASAFSAPLAGMLYAIEEYMNLRCIGLGVVLIGVASTFAAWTSTALHYQFDEYVGFKGFKDKVLRVDFGRTEEISHDWGHHGRILMVAILIAIITSAVGLLFQKSVLSLRLFNNKKVSQKVPPRYFGFIAGFLASIIGCLLFTLTLSEGSWGVGHAHYGELLTEPSCEEVQANFVSMYRKREHEEPKPKKYWRYLRNRSVMDPLSPNYDEQYVEYPSKYACRDWGFHLTFFILKTVCILISVSVGGPGGIFFPALLLGGSVGSTVAGIFSALDPEYAEQYRILPVLAMVGLFSSLMRTPMTAILVTYEMSGYGIIGLKPGLTFYMIITSALSYLICEQVQHVDLVMCVMAQDGIDFKLRIFPR